MPKRHKPTQLENSGRLVRKAAKVLRDRKWVQGQVGTKDSGMCAIGVISYTANVDPKVAQAKIFFSEFFSNNLVGNKQTTLAGNAVIDFGEWLKNSGLYESSYVAGWNDAPGRTKEEVIQYMEKFADEVDPQRP